MTAYETCPFCEGFDEYDREGFKTKCSHCGEEIMLCDKCLNSEDNPNRVCNWHEVIKGGISYGVCFRGTTKHVIREQYAEEV